MALTMRPAPVGAAPVFAPARTSPVVRTEGAGIVVALQGESDISTRRVLWNVLSRIIAFGVGDVVVDLGEATFIDTAIVRCFATSHQLLDPQGRKLTFRSPPRLAARVLDVFGLTDLIETKQSVQL